MNILFIYSSVIENKSRLRQWQVGSAAAINFIVKGLQRVNKLKGHSRSQEISLTDELSLHIKVSCSNHEYISLFMTLLPQYAAKSM